MHSIFRLANEGEESDLRKAVMEENLHSIFRLANEGEESDLRRAIIEQNLHSIFRLMKEGEESDLRKVVVEQNLHSIFRMLGEGEESDFRKAVVEQNLHAIFRVLGEGEESNLRKLILENNIYKLWPILEEEVDTSLVGTFKTFHRLGIEYDKDCFSRGQLYSKMWLIEELSKVTNSLGTVFLCAGWYATLSTMLFEKGFEIDVVRSFDIDPKCVQIAEIFNKKWVMDDWKFKAAIEDIHNIDYSTHSYNVTRSDGSSCPLYDSPNTIINTSCEHIENFEEWYKSIPSGKLVILQTNNYFEIEDHVNCVNDLAEFEKMSPMEIQCFTGALPLEHYTRFMRIGYK